ncbi:MAG: Abi family protein [Lactobacillus sp.]|nr:Abi family protein [Lactobacillus sp.]
MISNDDASSLSPDEQRKLFEDRGIIFTESNDKNNDKIQEIGYYKLKEFAYAFANHSNDESELEIKYNNLKFSDLLNRYYQDKYLRIYVFHAIDDIEVYLNNVVASILGKRYGAYGYLVFNKWCDQSYSRDKIENIQDSFKQNLQKKISRSNLPDINQNRNRDSEGFPTVWLMVDCLTFGDTIYLVKNMSINNKRRIARKFNCSTQELMSWLSCINFIRNVCVHNSDLLDISFTTKPKVPTQYSDYILQINNIYSNKIAISIYIIKTLMNSINSKYRFKNIKRTIEKVIKNDETIAKRLGFKNCESIKVLLR